MARELTAFLTAFALFALATIGVTKWEQNRQRAQYEATFKERLEGKLKDKKFAQKWHKVESFDTIDNFLLTPYNLKREKEKRLKVNSKTAVNF